MFKINDYITKENYTAGAIWCNQNNAMIAVLKEGGRVRYQIQAVSVAPEPSYAEKRAAEYPPMADQLDMQYWDAVNGTNIWKDTIAGIKEKYPKPLEERETVEENETVETPQSESAGV